MNAATITGGFMENKEELIEELTKSLDYIQGKAEYFSRVGFSNKELMSYIFVLLRICRDLLKEKS